MAELGEEKLIYSRGTKLLIFLALNLCHYQDLRAP